MTFFAILVALYGSPTAETGSERAARVADTYQPRAPKMRAAGRVSCVTVIDSKGNIESHRCDL